MSWGMIEEGWPWEGGIKDRKSGSSGPIGRYRDEAAS